MSTLGTLVNAYGALGGTAVGVKAGESAVRACVEMLFFGLGVATVASCAGWAIGRAMPQPVSSWARPLTPHAALLILLAGMAAYRYSAFAARDDYVLNRNISLDTFTAPELAAIHPWLRAHTRPHDVFLTAESAGLSIVGPAGRKAVVVPVSFSNPYVSWEARKHAEAALWEALVAGDCARFRATARAVRVTYVLMAAGRTPLVEAGACGLEPTSFAGSALRVLRVAASPGES